MDKVYFIKNVSDFLQEAWAHHIKTYKNKLPEKPEEVFAEINDAIKAIRQE